MAVERTVRSFESLNLRNLDEEWVKDVFDNQFAAFDVQALSIEEDLQEHDYFVKELKDLNERLQPWVRGEKAETGEGLWTVLVEHDISYKTLLALLNSIIISGHKHASSAMQREASIEASSSYFSLVAVPGSGAFRIFHPVLFQNAIGGFSMWKKLDGGGRKRKSGPVKSSQKGRAGRKRSRRSSDGYQPEDNSNPFDDDEDDDAVLTPQETTGILRHLMGLLKTFVRLLEHMSLRENQDTVQQCIQCLGELTRLEPETAPTEINLDRNVKHIHTVSELGYKGLEAICNGRHGDTKMMITAVFRHLRPAILMLADGNKTYAGSTIPKPIQQLKSNAVSYVCHIVRSHEEESRTSLRILLQHLCVGVPDRAEYRKLVAEAVVAILSEMPTPAYARCIQWLFNFGRNVKIGYRVFGLGVASQLVNIPERQPTEGMDPEHLPCLSKTFFLHWILARCMDVSSSVRAKAIVCLAGCTESEEDDLRTAIRDLVVLKTTNENGGNLPGSAMQPGSAENSAPSSPGGTVNSRASLDTVASPSTRDSLESNQEQQTPLNLPSATTSRGSMTAMATLFLTPGVEISLQDGEGLVGMLRRRAGDEKSNVRKAALQALANLVRMDTTKINNHNLLVLEERCRDPAVSVRKQALDSLTNLLMDLPDSPDIHLAWLSGVLPMVVDRETAAQEKCLGYLQDIFLSNLVPYKRSNSTEHHMAWTMLKQIAEPSGFEFRSYVQNACQQWGRSKVLKSSHITTLQTHINTENNQAAWMFLAEIVPQCGTFAFQFVMDYWEENTQETSDVPADTMSNVLAIIGHIATHLDEEEIRKIGLSLKNMLLKFNSSNELITVIVVTMTKLSQALTKEVTEARKIAEAWFSDVLAACDSYLSTAILNSQEDLPEVELICHLFTLGEVALMCPARTPKHVFMLVQSIIAAPVANEAADGEAENANDGEADRPNKDSGKQVSTGSEPEKDNQPEKDAQPGKDAHSDKDGKTGVEVTSPIASSQPPLSQILSQEILSQFRGSKMSGKLRAHAFMTLGKLCLVHEDLAKKCVAAMARELETSPDSAVRNNVVVILSDLCIRYTTLVDRHVSNMSACVRDRSPLVRKQTLTVLTRLLQEDYLKWKGSLFYRFVIGIIDNIKEIGKFAEFCMVHLLMKRHPTMFFQHFVECIFHFNSYDKHTAYNKFAQTDLEKERFSLKGQGNFRKRMKIYQFLLEHMTDEQKFKLTARMCQDVLGAVVDETLLLDAESCSLVRDTLSILSSKEIKLSSLNAKQPDEADDEEAMAAAVMNAAKKTIITKVVKKNVIENVVPTVISLKHMLEKQHSAVLKDLMVFLRELLKDYKNEVQEILVGDKQLATEIEFDMRKFEEEEAERQRQRLLSIQSLDSTLTSPGSARPTPRGWPARHTPRASPAKGTGSPTRPTSPRVGSPGRGVIHTPARNVPLSTLAIMNSARKAMRTAAEVASPKADRTKKRVAFSSSDTCDSLAGVSTNTDSFKTPNPANRTKKIDCSRAMSTPSTNFTLNNVTFQQGDFNLSLISPATPSNRQSDVVTTPRLSVNSTKDEPTPVLHMMSPDKPGPKPRKWNVKTPSSIAVSESEDENKENSESEAEDSKFLSISGNRRSSRRVSNSSRVTRSESISPQPQPRGGRRKKGTEANSSTRQSVIKTRRNLEETETTTSTEPRRRSKTRRSLEETETTTSTGPGRRRSRRK